MTMMIHIAYSESLLLWGIVLPYYDVYKYLLISSRSYTNYIALICQLKCLVSKSQFITQSLTNYTLFLYKKVVYKKVYIKRPKIKKVRIYNLAKPRNFIRKPGRKYYELTRVPTKNYYMDNKRDTSKFLWPKCIEVINSFVIEALR